MVRRCAEVVNSLCRERHWCSAHGWPPGQQLFVVISRSPSVAGDSDWIRFGLGQDFHGTLWTGLDRV